MRSDRHVRLPLRRGVRNSPPVAGPKTSLPSDWSFRQVCDRQRAYCPVFDIATAAVRPGDRSPPFPAPCSSHFDPENSSKTSGRVVSCILSSLREPLRGSDPDDGPTVWKPILPSAASCSGAANSRADDPWAQPARREAAFIKGTPTALWCVAVRCSGAVDGVRADVHGEDGIAFHEKDRAQIGFDGESMDRLA